MSFESHLGLLIICKGERNKDEADIKSIRKSGKDVLIADAFYKI